MILLDTHVVLWLAASPEKLSFEAKTAISFARKESGIAIADKTLWEIAYLLSSGQVKLTAPIREVLTMIEHRFVVLPITAAIAERSMLFTRNYPKDPADRLIGATALVHTIELVTADRAIRQSGEVPCIW